MLYWIFLIILFVTLIGSLFWIWRKRIKDDDMENDVFGMLVFAACLSFIFLIPCTIDIPCALRGGQEMYVNELPSYIGFGTLRRTVTDNKELKRLTGCNWDAYDKHGNYRICYTSVTKIVLDIEKLG